MGLVTLLDRIASYLGCWQIVLYNISALGIVFLIFCFTCFCCRGIIRRDNGNPPGLRISAGFRQVSGFEGVGQRFANPSFKFYGNPDLGEMLIRARDDRKIKFYGIFLHIGKFLTCWQFNVAGKFVT